MAAPALSPHNLLRYPASQGEHRAALLELDQQTLLGGWQRPRQPFWCAFQRLPRVRKDVANARPSKIPFGSCEFSRERKFEVCISAKLRNASLL
jgi:hypothetical protein